MPNNSSPAPDKSPIVEYVLQHPPSCITAFDVMPASLSDDFDITARFKLYCKTCGSSKWRILCFPLTVSSSDELVGVAAGEVIECNPHYVQCVACNGRHLVFDASKHGYDGALGHGSSYPQGNAGERAIHCQRNAYEVHVAFIYNIEEEELSEIAKESDRKIEDLFDWFHIQAIEADGAILSDLDYECA